MKLRARVLTRLPATLAADGGLQVVKENGRWTFSPAWEQLALEGSLPDPENRHLWAFNPQTGVYTRINADTLINTVSGSFVSVNPTEYTPEQQEQARENVGLGETDSVDFASGVLAGNNSAVAPTLNSTSFLELINTSSAAQYIGSEIRFGTVAGNPWQVIKSELISGPSPYIGNLSFYSRETTAGALTRRLRLSGGGSFHSGPDNATHVAGPYNYGAVNAKGFQNFIGYTSNAGLADPANAATISAYFTADNNDLTGAPGTGATAVYGDAKVWNSGSAIGAEIDCQNMSGLNSRDINPNQMFGSGPGPWTVSFWTQSAGTLFEQSWDISAALGIVQAIHTAGTLPKFRKGIVVDVNAIQSVSGRKEALTLPANNEVTWWDATGANINRFLGDGTNFSAYGQNFFLRSANATSTSLVIGQDSTGDRSARLYFGASSGGGSQDATIHRVGGANGQFQLSNQGTGTFAVILNGSNGLLINGSTRILTLPAYTAGALSTNGSGVVSAGALSVANGGTGGITAQAATANLAAPYVTKSFVSVSRASVNAVGDATETVLATATIPSGAMGPNGFIKVYSYWNVTGGTASKTYRTRWGGLAGTIARQSSITTTYTTREEAVVANRNSASSQYISNPSAGAGGWSASASVATATLDTTAAVDVVFTAAWAAATAGETIILEGYIVEVYYGA